MEATSHTTAMVQSYLVAVRQSHPFCMITTTSRILECNPLAFLYNHAPMACGGYIGHRCNGTGLCCAPATSVHCALPNCIVFHGADGNLFLGVCLSWFTRPTMCTSTTTELLCVLCTIQEYCVNYHSVHPFVYYKSYMLISRWA